MNVLFEGNAVVLSYGVEHKLHLIIKSDDSIYFLLDGQEHTAEFMKKVTLLAMTAGANLEAESSIKGFHVSIELLPPGDHSGAFYQFCVWGDGDTANRSVMCFEHRDMLKAFQFLTEIHEYDH